MHTETPDVPPLASEATDGPTTWVRPAGQEWHRAAKVPGSTVSLFIDSSVPGADLYGGFNVLAPGAVIPLHWHSVGELQFVLAGSGLALDASGAASALGPHSVVFAPGGPSGAHGFVNNGLVPLWILFLYPSPGGEAPDIHFVAPLEG